MDLGNEGTIPAGAGDPYLKILAPYRRYAQTEEPLLRNTLINGAWATPEFELLSTQPWEWTEKVNGTNVRVLWDGYKVRVRGRTDNASMPIKLLDVLAATFPEELMEQVFGATPATLYGEGFGPDVAAGSGIYRTTPGFVLFDINIGGWWLQRSKLEETAVALGIELVPLVLRAGILAAIQLVRQGVVSAWGSFPVEGLVGKAPLGLLDRGGNRIMTKVKTKDFPR